MCVCVCVCLHENTHERNNTLLSLLVLTLYLCLFSPSLVVLLLLQLSSTLLLPRAFFSFCFVSTLSVCVDHVGVCLFKLYSYGFMYVCMYVCLMQTQSKLQHLHCRRVCVGVDTCIKFMFNLWFVYLYVLQVQMCVCVCMCVSLWVVLCATYYIHSCLSEQRADCCIQMMSKGTEHAKQCWLKLTLQR